MKILKKNKNEQVGEAEEAEREESIEKNRKSWKWKIEEEAVVGKCINHFLGLFSFLFQFGCI